MSAERRTAWVTHAPAKVNLDLRLLGQRGDGYHLLSTVLQTVALADRLLLRPADGPFSLLCDSPGVPLDAANLAWRGAAAMASSLGFTLDGWTLQLEKRVPAEAGLGGGSSDAVAAARLVAAAAGVDLPPERLAEVVRPIGADVAFFAWGGTMRGEGVGDDLTALADVPDSAVLLVRPPFGVSTRDAYRWADTDLARRLERADEAAALRSGEGHCPPWGACRNDLEAPVTARRPEIGRIVARLRDAGARLAAMSGSGSACYGLYGLSGVPVALLAGWPDGTRVWQTTLLSRAAYAVATRCRPVEPATRRLPS